jgi:hypothetical protein
MYRFKLVAVVVVMFLAVSSMASAGGIKVKPGVYDPEKTGCPEASWDAKAGLPDAGKSNHGLVLIKDCPTPTNAAAGANVDGVEGLSAAGLVLGFDYDITGLCTGGSPRFNVQWTDVSNPNGFSFVGGCANAEAPTSPAPGWLTARFELQDATDAFPIVPATATIVSITIISDEQGTSIIDNIYIGGTVVEKPGNA